MQTHRIIRNTQPIDIATIAYLLVTGIFIIFGFHKIDNPVWHLTAHFSLIVAIYFLIRLNIKVNNSAVKFLRNFYPLLLLSFFYIETDALNNVLLPNLDPVISNIEATVFGGQPSIWFSQYFPWRWFSELMNFGYFSFYLLITFLCIWLYYKNKENFHFSLFVICMSFYMFYILFILFPVIGPQFYFTPSNRLVPDGYVIGKFMKFINETAEKPTGAFPSSHVGIVVILWYLLYKYAKPLLFWYIPIGILLILSTVYLKAHYVVDVAAGMLSAPTMYWLSSHTYHSLDSSLTESTSFYFFLRNVYLKINQSITNFLHIFRKKKE